MEKIVRLCESSKLGFGQRVLRRLLCTLNLRGIKVTTNNQRIKGSKNRILRIGILISLKHVTGTTSRNNKIGIAGIFF